MDGDEEVGCEERDGECEDGEHESRESCSRAFDASADMNTHVHTNAYTKANTYADTRFGEQGDCLTGPALQMLLAEDKHERHHQTSQPYFET